MSLDLATLNKSKRCKLASTSTTPHALLQILANDSETDVRKCVAGNDNTSTEVLTKLSEDPSYLVRICVAKHEFTPPQILAVLAKDFAQTVRRSVAQNPSTTPTALAILASHKDEYTLWSVAQNPSASSQTLAELSEKLDYLRPTIALNPAASFSLLTRLSQDENQTVRLNVVQNSSTPASLIESIYQQEVQNDSLTEQFALTVIKSKVRLPDTEYCALIASFGSTVANTIYVRIKFSSTSILAKQLSNCGLPIPISPDHAYPSH